MSTFAYSFNTGGLLFQYLSRCSAHVCRAVNLDTHQRLRLHLPRDSHSIHDRTTSARYTVIATWQVVGEREWGGALDTLWA